MADREKLGLNPAQLRELPQTYIGGRGHSMQVDAMAGVLAKVNDDLNQFADKQAIMAGTQQGMDAGMKPDFQPLRGTSLYAQAFDRAGLESYRNNLEVTATEAAQRIAMETRGDPGQLRQRLDDYAAGMQQDLVPEMRGDFQKIWSRRTLALTAQAQEDYERTVLDGLAASAMQATEKQTNMALGLARNVADDGVALRMLGEERQSLLTKLLENAPREGGQFEDRKLEPDPMRMPVWTFKQIAQIMSRFDGEAAEQRVLGKFERTTDKAGFIGQFQKSATDGQFSPDVIDRLTSKMEVEVRREQAAARAVAVDAARTVKTVSDALDDGRPVTEGEMDAARQASTLAGGDGKALDYKRDEMTLLRGMSLLDLENTITELDAAARGKSPVTDTAGIRIDQPSPEGLTPEGEQRQLVARERLDWAKTVQRQLRETINGGDLVGWWANYGGGDVQPFMQNTADGLGVAFDNAALAKRNKAFFETRRLYGQGSVMRPAENDEISRLFDTMSPDNARNMLGRFSATLQPEAVRSFAKSIAPKNPAVAAAMVADTPDIARRIILGSKSKYEPPAGLTAAIQGALGAAIMDDPSAKETTVRAVEALYREKAERQTLGKMAINTDALAESVKEATGGLVTHNDRTLLPYRYGGEYVDTAGFANVLKDVESYGDAWVDKAIGLPYNDQGQPISFRQLRNGFTWNSVGAGKYAMRDRGGNAAYTKDGREYIIDMPTLHLMRDETWVSRRNRQ